jgi:SAM-dependent methyltransferase
MTSRPQHSLQHATSGPVLDASQLPILEPLPPLRLSPRLKAPGATSFEQHIREKAAQTTGTLRILEAGCGNKWSLNLAGVNYTLTGVDVDRDALEIRKNKVRDTDEICVGDLRTTELFAPGSFDVIYNSFVLEHVDGAEKVLDNFMLWLAPGGLLLVRFPDRNSVYGFLTRVTPFWFHVFVKKYIQGVPNAGKPGFDPYPTHYDSVLSRHGIRAHCRSQAGIVRDEYGNAGYLPKGRLRYGLAFIVVRLIGALSMGRLDWRYNNLAFVIEKR